MAGELSLDALQQPPVSFSCPDTLWDVVLRPVRLYLAAAHSRRTACAEGGNRSTDSAGRSGGLTEQDSQLDQLSSHISRLSSISQAVNEEITLQNQMLVGSPARLHASTFRWCWLVVVSLSITPLPDICFRER